MAGARAPSAMKHTPQGQFLKISHSLRLYNWLINYLLGWIMSWLADYQVNYLANQIDNFPDS